MTNDYPVPDMADVHLVDVLRAVADPIRLRIVTVLGDGEPHSKSAPDWGFDVQKSTLAHHFKALREAGITRTIVDGRSHAIQLRRAELDARFPGLVDALTHGADGGAGADAVAVADADAG
ncbi:ArsR/SmtB family transcription factor [Herbiconiux sp. UC225_62]|uniref:ArsR/SmtB family transcription factor n=1 Tax=Herbiconiux sp. UC225_62 TaxID=3350168 RepID=UPI0036D2EFC1